VCLFAIALTPAIRATPAVGRPLQSTVVSSRPVRRDQDRRGRRSSSWPWSRWCSRGSAWIGSTAETCSRG